MWKCLNHSSVSLFCIQFFFFAIFCYCHKIHSLFAKHLFASYYYYSIPVGTVQNMYVSLPKQYFPKFKFQFNSIKCFHCFRGYRLGFFFFHYLVAILRELVSIVWGNCIIVSLPLEQWIQWIFCSNIIRIKVRLYRRAKTYQTGQIIIVHWLVKMI